MRYIKTLLIIFFLAIAACEQKGASDYSSPEATYRTYVRQAKTLRVVADTRNYRRAIRCFTDEDWKWFEKNFNGIELQKEDLYDSLYRSKKLAYVFGRALVPAGPDPEAEGYRFTEISPNQAELEVPGYGKKIKFVKIGRGWVMEGLFGIREKTAS